MSISTAIRCTYRPLIALITLSIFMIPSHAGWNEGKSAADSGDYDTAYQEFLPLAEQGHVSAQTMLGVMYFNGQGVPQDYDAALVWLNLAANSGHDVAQFNLGVMYDSGTGIEQDFLEAVRWYSMASARGHSQAQFNLGSMYRYGDGVDADPVKALMWLSISAAQGNQDANNSQSELMATLSDEQINQAQLMAAECVDNQYQGCE